MWWWIVLVVTVTLVAMLLIIVRCFRAPTKELANDDEVAEQLQRGWSVVLVYSSGCTWCDRMKPEFIRLARETSGWEFAMVEARNVPVTMEKYAIEGFPTVLIRGRDQTSPVAGYLSYDQLARKLESWEVEKKGL